MNNSIFRKESLDRISSPEQLDDYIKVTSPGVWMFMSGIILVLIGFCVWLFVGRMEGTISTGGVVANGELKFYLSEDEISKIEPGMKIKVNGIETEVSSVDAKACKVTEEFDKYLAGLIGADEADEWLFEFKTKADTKDGTYKVIIVEEVVKPSTFVIN